MEFDSQICTTEEQSKRLLALGLKKETADMCYQVKFFDPFPQILVDCTPSLLTHPPIDNERFIPAWSLHRLIEMLNYQVRYNGKTYEPAIAIDGMAYYDICTDDPIVGWSRDLYIDAIDCIEWLISIEQFNKEYLEEK